MFEHVPLLLQTFSFAVRLSLAFRSRIACSGMGNLVISAQSWTNPD